MDAGQVRERTRNGRTEYWVEVWWGNPKERYTFTQIPVPGPNGTEWHSCAENKPMAEFLLSIIRGRIKDKTFHPDEFRKKSPMQFDVYARNWLKIKKPNVGAGHYHVMEWAIEKYLIPHLGSSYLLNLSKNRLRQLQNDLKGKNRDLSLKSKKNIMDTLSWMLNDACPEYISMVPKFPGFKGGESIIPRDIRVPAVETILSVINTIPERHRWPYLFMAYTGCRPSESRAFRKQDIEQYFLMFVKTFERGDKEVPVKGKKPLPFPRTEAVNLILKNAPDDLAPSPYRFINPDTREHYTENEINKIWRTAYREAGFSYLKLYDCTRHAFATMMRMGGMKLEDIRDLMRHSDIKTTGIYDHSSITRLAPMIDKILPFPGGKTVGGPLAKSDKSSNIMN